MICNIGEGVVLLFFVYCIILIREVVMKVVLVIDGVVCFDYK